MNTIAISVSIPASLFEWLKKAVASGSYASVDAVVVAGIEQLQAETDYLTQVEEWANTFEQSALYRLAHEDTPSASLQIREVTVAYGVEMYDEVYYEAMDEVYPSLTLPAQTSVGVPPNFAG